MLVQRRKAVFEGKRKRMNASMDCRGLGCWFICRLSSAGEMLDICDNSRRGTKIRLLTDGATAGKFSSLGRPHQIE